MSQKITTGGSFTVNNNGNVLTLPTTYAITTSGSLYASSVMNVTSSTWQAIDQNKNVDFFVGVFANESTSSYLNLAIGNTGSYTVLWPNQLNILSFSGSTNLWVRCPSGVSQLSYTAVSMN